MCADHDHGWSGLKIKVTGQGQELGSELKFGVSKDSNEIGLSSQPPHGTGGTRPIQLPRSRGPSVFWSTPTFATGGRFSLPQTSLLSLRGEGKKSRELGNG